MSKYDLTFPIPLLNSSGTLGFAPDAQVMAGVPPLGAFVTNPISLEPRFPAHPPRCLPFTGGFLLHTGWPNPGFRAVLRACRERWARSDLPVVVHLLALSPSEVSRMVERLEGLEGILGVELGIPPGASAQDAASWVSAGVGELPIIARLPLDQASDLAASVSSAGAAAISLGAPRGALPAPDGRLIQGRLYGPALFPQALGTLHALAPLGLPVLASGGIYSPANAEILLSAGAAAVQLDAVLWQGSWMSSSWVSGG
jgi:dihydroorotate dehydrogenase (NAD+) catalytic subunit